jgi:DMSO/TMAO reductase YedYZ molybdopterin-dependent catalytic subunit
LVAGWFRDFLEKEKPVAKFEEKDISPYFWPQGKEPDSEEYRSHLAQQFKNYKLKVGGLVENPVEFSYAELQSMPKSEQIGQHYCIQGWSGMRFEPPRYHCGYSSRAFPPEKVLHPILGQNIVLAIAIDYKI